MEGTATPELPAPTPAVPQVQLGTVLQIPAVRQVLALVGIAASVAFGVAIFMWSRAPDYAVLYGGLEERDAAVVVEALRASGIEFDVDSATGNIRVRSDQVHDARMQLAAQGLPMTQSRGMDSVSDSSFGVSQFMESARYQHALEAELSRTIKSLRPVREARVHLAIPKQTAFIRDQQRPGASVLLHLYSGQQLERDQAAAIINLVAGSIPAMAAEDVTLVDQFGRMLSVTPEMEQDGLTETQFRIARERELDLARRVTTQLTRLLGPGAVEVTVNAELDFTMSEQTTESFDPASQVVRSEQLSEEQRRAGDAEPGGVPGALANTPPAAGGAAAVENGGAVETTDTARRELRNYEVDRTISRIRNPIGTVRRLSVAVLINETALMRPAVVEAPEEGDAAAEEEAAEAEDGEEAAVVEAPPPEPVMDLAEIEAVVRNAVGFDAARGDTVTVVAGAFYEQLAMEDTGGPPLWEQPAIRELAKQAVGVILALALAFGIVRPMLKTVVEVPPPPPVSNLLPEPGDVSPENAARLEGPGGGLSYQEKVAAARNITGHDPARVAQVVRKWIDTDDG